MKRLHLYIIKTYLGPFVMTFFIVLFILVMQFLWKYIDELVGKGLEWTVITELIFYASAALVPLALPLAVLLSSIMTFGSMGEHYELVALKSAGLSLQRIMFPLMVFIGITAIGAFYFSNNILPVANLKSATLLYSIRHKKPAIDISDRVFYKEIDGFVIRVEKNDREKNRLYDVLIYDHRENNGNRKVIRAKEGVMSLSKDERYLIFALYDGFSYEEMEGKTGPHLRTKFEEDIIRFDLSEFAFNRTDEDIFKNGYRMMNLNQLVDGIDTLRMEKKQLFEKLSGRFRSGHPLLNDSLRAFDKVTVKSHYLVDSLVASFTPAQQKLVYNNALSLVRRNKSLLVTTDKIVDSKETMIRKFKMEWHRKFVLSIACIVLFFIGAPLGAIIRKGGLGMPVVISVLFFLVYHITTITAEKMVKQGNLDVLTGMWLATMILTPIGIWLTYKATTDSAIMDSEAYSKLVSRIVQPFKRLFSRQSA